MLVATTVNKNPRIANPLAWGQVCRGTIHRVPTVLRNREKVGNVEMPFSRSGKSWKRSGIQSFVTSYVELGNYATYRNGRPLLESLLQKKYKHVGLVFPRLKV